MPNNASERDRGSVARSGSGKRSGSSSTARVMRTAVASAVSTEAILDIVERLGLVDLVVDRVKARIQDVDIDDLLDDIGDYMRRNPEVVVVALGTITVAAGVLVYLMRNEEGDFYRGEDREIDYPQEMETRTPASARRADSSRRPTTTRRGQESRT